MGRAASFIISVPPLSVASPPRPLHLAMGTTTLDDVNHSGSLGHSLTRPAVRPSQPSCFYTAPTPPHLLYVSGAKLRYCCAKAV